MLHAASGAAIATEVELVPAAASPRPSAILINPPGRLRDPGSPGRAVGASSRLRTPSSSSPGADRESMEAAAAAVAVARGAVSVQQKWLESQVSKE